MFTPAPPHKDYKTFKQLNLMVVPVGLAISIQITVKSANNGNPRDWKWPLCRQVGYNIGGLVGTY